MVRKLIICCLCGFLAGGLWSVAQDSQQVDAQQGSRRSHSVSNRGDRSDRPSSSSSQSGRSGRFSRSDNAGGNMGAPGGRSGGPPGMQNGGPGGRQGGPGGQPPDMGQPGEHPQEEMEEITEEDDTKNPLYGNPYRIIVTRNLFQLQASPALGNIVTNIMPMALNTNNLKFMGITTIGGVVKAHFMISKPGQRPPQQYISLTEGQASDGLECISINPDSRNPSAEVEADGKRIEVNFETHGITLGVRPTSNTQQNSQQNNQQSSRFNRSRSSSSGQPSSQGTSISSTQQQSGGFNMPAVSNSSQSNSRNMPMTREGQSYQSRRSSSGSGSTPTPPMPPGM